MALTHLRLAAYGTAADAQAAQTAVAIEATPLAPGFNAAWFVNMVGATGAPVIKIQSTDSVDPEDVGAEWTDLAATSGVLAQSQSGNLDIPAGALWLRTNVTTAAGAGDFDAYLLGAL